MILTMLKAKLHRATVTRADLDYEGSITIDLDLLEQAGILPHEQVDVLDITNGARLTTYAIPGPRASGEIGINGAAAHLVSPGDLVIICAYAQMDAQEARNFEPEILVLDEKNRVKNRPLQNNRAA
ncbi:MAG: aspartate 1-decarboxylase [Alphaproteobacteria bacterium]|nr:aspartate 1-decarboxylase [Alphaproteobacteria bacterium]MCB9975356.1 aspartate 1-decarboxylase [Rhodospirillales bacterium]